MTCRAARVTEDGGAHALSFRAISAEEAAAGYTARCLRCATRFKSAVEWLVVTCPPTVHAGVTPTAPRSRP
jgi:hypothetical protein